MHVQISSPHLPPVTMPTSLGAAPILLWQMAWLKAVGLAWSRPELESELLQDPRGFLKSRCGYELPEGINLEVRPYGAGDEQGVTWATGSGHEQRTMYLTLTLPPKPGTPQDAPVALADYMSVGQDFPATTC